MLARVFGILASLIITYSAFWAAYILIGQDKIKSAYVALVPAVVGALMALYTGSLVGVICIGMLLAIGYVGAAYLSGRNWSVSAVGCLIALTICLTEQRLLAITGLDGKLAFFASYISLVIPLGLWLFKIVIFPEEYILTKDQKQSVASQRLWLFPGLIVVIGWQGYILYQDVLTGLEIGEDSGTMPVLIFTILMQLVVLVQLRQQVRGSQERIENIIDKQYQAELLNFMRVIRSQRHDFNFHTQTIYGMIEGEQYDECKDYVRSMMSQVRSTNDILPLYHPATSALLNTFREMAFQKSIKMEIEIHDNMQFIASPVFETNTILGNLLQNAMDELELHPENDSKVIKLLIIKRGRYNMIKVSNQCHLPPEQMSQIFMPGFTTKNSHEGLGLANALRVAEKYDGTVYPEFEGNIVHFIARIPIKN